MRKASTLAQGRRYRTAGITGLVALLLLAGCSARDAAPDREVIQKEEKTITVVGSEPVQKPAGIVVAKIDTLQGVRGMDWIGEEQLIVAKPNEQAAPIAVEGGTRYPFNLFVRDLAAGTDEILKQANEDQGGAIVSPDQKHVFYKQYEGETAKGLILNLDTGEAVPAGDTPIGISDGEWADNERIVFTTEDGSLARADVTGKTELLYRTGDFAAANPRQRGDIVYYVGRNYSLNAYNTQTKKNERIASDVIWFIPSPDGKHFAVVKRVSKDGQPLQMELVLTDTALKAKKTIAKGNQIFGASWSPDGARIGYTVTSEGGGTQGVFVADAVSGGATPVSVDVQYASDPLRWSPSGGKLITGTSEMKDNRMTFKTFVTTFK
ncbi:hypothetical protein [Paenibacillus methanolicus]|uniref:TolB protein n=1 Tax=Paenibacillus methanolicus TaxID=582686 RepID=A0A5S5BYU6_9BACL|nr:hypothetical protein [Paenibacillus methanolicus]TYP71382.1 TolB protein [Paenibacillus methanolicus]